MSAAIELDSLPVDRQIYNALVCDIDGESNDPRYSDAFIEIKSEIDKLTGINTRVIVENALAVTSSEAKDLRVIAYLMSASFYARNVVGLCEVLHAIPVVLEKFGIKIYPKSKSARINSIHWLNSVKHTRLVNKHYANLAGDEMSALVKALAAANEALQSYIASDIRIACFDDVICEIPDRPDESGQEAESVSDTVIAIKPEINEKKSVYALADYYLEKENYEAAINISRTYRWSTVFDIPHENYITRLAEPRMSILNDINEDQNPVDIIVRIEKLFREPGAQFLIVLQKTQYEAAEKAGLRHVADAIASSLVRMKKRVRDFGQLKYSSGTAFAADSVYAWLSRLDNKKPFPGGDHVKVNTSVYFEEAEKIRCDKGLPDAISYLQSVNCETISGSLRRDLRLYEMIMEFGSKKLAMIALSKLYSNIKSTCAPLWDKELVTRTLMYIRDVNDRSDYGLPDDHEIYTLLYDADISAAILLTK